LKQNHRRRHHLLQSSGKEESLTQNEKTPTKTTRATKTQQQIMWTRDPTNTWKEIWIEENVVEEESVTVVRRWKLIAPPP
jgi:hypothetical protein